MDQEETREQLDNITEALKRLIGQTQLKASLLKLEAQSAWKEMEKGLSKIQSYLKKDWKQTEQDMGEVQLRTHLAMMEAREEWGEFKDHFSQTIRSLKTEQEYDHAKVQAHLAKMELEDRFKEKKVEWEKNYKTVVKPRIKASMEEMHKEMEIMAQGLIE